jgi:UDP-N-acetylmuramoyl-L-alanyl-D-glutamate--2,6-diaminopimelate ligase
METSQEKHLSSIIGDLKDAIIHGSGDVIIKNIILDSRKVLPGSLFVALRGTQTDGHQYITTAAGLGASAILCEELPENPSSEVTYIQVEDSAAAMGLIAAAFYGYPSGKLTLVGVTGTNGKTSVATFLFQLFRALGYRCGLLSTVQNQIEDEIIPSTHTTPDSVALNQLLSKMLASNCSHVFMEVSSHAVAQHRITGLQFAGGFSPTLPTTTSIFTRLLTITLKPKKVSLINCLKPRLHW